MLRFPDDGLPTLKAARAFVGGVSTPSKMPGLSWNISAKRCKIGALLRANVENSVCASCYALKGRYSFRNVINAQERRLAAFDNAISTGNMHKWAKAMAMLAASRASKGYFRFFDSGDLQSFAMLQAIIMVAKYAPNVKFWLPTREYPIISEALEFGLISTDQFPNNLVIRISAPSINQTAGWALADAHRNITLSAVYDKGTTAYSSAYNCPAYKQGGKCGECRACWQRLNLLIVYPKH
jgi:hypothetical protein